MTNQPAPPLKWKWLPILNGDTSVIFGAGRNPHDPEDYLFGVEVVMPSPDDAPTTMLNMGQAKRLHRWLGERIKEVEDGQRQYRR